jgi:hypothetical protein
MSGTGDEILQRFRLKLLTEGSGTQLFSTSFAQWTAREVLRRAQALTLLVRFAPRQRQKPMNELLSANSNQQEMDVAGSLMDADMGAYYNWLNQQRLPGRRSRPFSSGLRVITPLLQLVLQYLARQNQSQRRI